MIRPGIVATLIPLLLIGCAGHTPPAAEISSQTSPAQSSVTPEAGPEQAGKAPTDSDVMYRVFAAEILGNEGDLQGAVAQYLQAAMESSDPAIAMRATRVAFAAQAWLQASMAADRWSLLDPRSLPARESTCPEAA